MTSAPRGVGVANDPRIILYQIHFIIVQRWPPGLTLSSYGSCFPKRNNYIFSKKKSKFWTGADASRASALPIVNCGSHVLIKDNINVLRCQVAVNFGKLKINVNDDSSGSRIIRNKNCTQTVNLLIRGLFFNFRSNISFHNTHSHKCLSTSAFLRRD